MYSCTLYRAFPVLGARDTYINNSDCHCMYKDFQLHGYFAMVSALHQEYRTAKETVFHLAQYL